MTKEEQREQVIQNITGLLRRHGFSFEFVVKKNPKGIKIIQEVTQEELDRLIGNAQKKEEGKV